MSKVKIQGNASGTGTLTISAPNTNTDRTLTLPDGAGEILTDASTLSSSNLSGALPAIDGSALTGITTGKILQVVSAKYSTQVSNSSGTSFDTGLTANITPSSTSSKIAIFVSQNSGGSTGGGSNNIDYWIRIVKVESGSGTTIYETKARYDNITNQYITGISQSLTTVDSPSSTNTLTYKTTMREANAASKLVQAQYSNTTSSIVLMEIEG